MDYCSTCRRHLNGALVCPGCGAYAPDIAPSVIGGHTVPGTATEATASKAGVRPPAPRPDDIPAQPVSVAAGTGRAARRRQVARWKKTQRRALVATAVALVGGGLTLASVDRSGGDRAQAAGAPDLRGMGGGNDLADQYDDPQDGVPSASPERTEQAPPAGDRGKSVAPDATPAPGTPSDTRTESAAVSDTAVSTRPSQPSQRSAAGSGDGAGADGGSASGAREGGGSSTVAPPTTPPPAADDDGGDGGSDGSGGAGQGQGTPSDPSATAPDSSQLCLLVICLG